MAGRLKQFVKQTKDKKDEESKRQQEVVEQALGMVPRCELNEDLPEDASGRALWNAIHKKFEWSFGPSKGKSLKDTKTQFLKWAVRKLKDPVRTMCQIELMMREKKLPEETGPQEPAVESTPTGSPAIADAETAIDQQRSPQPDTSGENSSGG